VLKDNRSRPFSQMNVDELLARDQQNWEAAWQRFSAVQEWFETRKDPTPRDEDLALGNMGQLGWVAYHLGRHEEARKRLQECLKSFSARSKGYTATLKYRLALVEEALGDTAEAYACASDATYWFERTGMQPDLEKARELLARLQSAQASPA